MDVLTERNFLLYAAKNYDNPVCHSKEEFNDDIRRIKYVKKLLTKYKATGELKERLILNHIIVLSNIFPVEALCRILFLKMEQDFHLVKPFLLMINCLVTNILNVKMPRNVDTDMIAMDMKIVDALRKI